MGPGRHDPVWDGVWRGLPGRGSWWDTAASHASGFLQERRVPSLAAVPAGRQALSLHRAKRPCRSSQRLCWRTGRGATPRNLSPGQRCALCGSGLPAVPGRRHPARPVVRQRSPGPVGPAHTDPGARRPIQPRKWGGFSLEDRNNRLRERHAEDGPPHLVRPDWGDAEHRGTRTASTTSRTFVFRGTTNAWRRRWSIRNWASPTSGCSTSPEAAARGSRSARRSTPPRSGRRTATALPFAPIARA